MPQFDDATIIVALQAGDYKAAFALLMARYKEAIYWHIRRLVVVHEDAQDATQETFIRVYRHLATVQREESLRAWLYTIASREAMRLIESRRHAPYALQDALEQTAGQGIATHDMYATDADDISIRLQQAIQTLPPKQQLCFNLRYYDELSFEEIALVLEVSPSSAKANYHLAKEKIVKYMTQ